MQLQDWTLQTLCTILILFGNYCPSRTMVIQEHYRPLLDHFNIQCFFAVEWLSQKYKLLPFRVSDLSLSFPKVQPESVNA